MTMPVQALPAGAALALFAAMALQGIQLLSLGPWSANWPLIRTWPTPFHLWLVESALIVSGGVLWALHATRQGWQVWLHQASGRQLSLLLFGALVGVQVLLGLAFWLTRKQGVDELGGLRAVFWLGGEFRLPVLFAVLQAWLAAWLAWQVYRKEGPRVWAASALVCAYIGLDELLSIHEAVGVAFRTSAWLEFDSMNTLALGGGVHVYAWQLVFLPMAAVVGLWLLNGFRQLVDARSLALLVLGAMLFITGCVGFEAVQATASTQGAGWLLTDAGHLNLLLEETLETAGMTLAAFVFASRVWQRPFVSSHDSKATRPRSAPNPEAV